MSNVRYTKYHAGVHDALFDRGQSMFATSDIARLAGVSSGAARSLVHRMVRRGQATRLQRDLFTATEFPGDPLLTARALSSGAPYYVSHATAMEIHGMTTQPQFVVYTSSPKRLRARTIHSTDFRFVFLPKAQVFGLMNHWVTKQEAVRVSDPARTILDGLRMPEYCGGVSEVAKALWIRREIVDVTRLIGYARRLGIGAVTRRLGFLLELYGLATARQLGGLRGTLTDTYSLLDPILPREGSYLAAWRLRINIPPEELDAVRGA